MNNFIKMYEWKKEISNLHTSVLDSDFNPTLVESVEEQIKVLTELQNNELAKFKEEFVVKEIPKIDFDKIKEFIKNNSYLNLDQCYDNEILFSTRENGCVATETASAIDLKHAQEVKIKVLKNFNDLEVDIEIVDEFVLFRVNPLIVKEKRYKYTFQKIDSKKCGFAESFNSFGELLNKFWHWVIVDWEDIKNQLDKVELNDKKEFKLLLKKDSDADNNFNYDFYIIKSIV